MSVDVLAIGAHPDDVELGCGATLALLARGGRRVGIVHLTGGEAGSRGTRDERRHEAEDAAAALGAVELEILDLGDGALRTGPAEEDLLIALLRRLRPELVLAPTPIEDRHPDHARSHRLVADACFYAGLARRGAGEPHRPAAVFAYMQHDPFVPSFVVDVTTSWAAKLAALACYRSQLYQPDAAPRTAPDAPSVAALAGAAGSAPGGLAPTRVASREFRQAVEGRARHFGQLVGVELGEPFFARGPLAVADPWSLRPAGLP